MQALVLSAGRGTRMGPLTETCPKPMLPVADRPLVAHVVDAAIAAGADEIVLTVGYRGQQVRNYFGTWYDGVPVRYAEQESQRGTADAVAAASERLDGDFVVLNGDSLYRAADLDALFDAVPAVGAYRAENPGEYGVFEAADGSLAEVVEKPEDPPSELINVGAYALPAEACDLLDVPESERGERELTDVLARVIERRDVELVPFESWLDVGYPWDLLEANERRLANVSRTHPHTEVDTLAGEVHPSATIQGQVVCEPGATIGPGVVVEGTVLVRSGSTIGPNAYVRGPTLVQPGAEIGHAVEVKNSVVMTDANVGHLSYVGDSVVGPRVNLGAGTNVANLRHDGASVEVTIDGETVSTDRRKFGAVLGPDVKTGIQTGVGPGVVLSAGSWTDPGAIVDRNR